MAATACRQNWIASRGVEPRGPRRHPHEPRPPGRLRYRGALQKARQRSTSGSGRARSPISGEGAMLRFRWSPGELVTGVVPVESALAGAKSRDPHRQGPLRADPPVVAAQDRDAQSVATTVVVGGIRQVHATQPPGAGAGAGVAVGGGAGSGGSVAGADWAIAAGAQSVAATTSRGRARMPPAYYRYARTEDHFVGWITISTRRLLARPSGEALSATGRSGPKPLAMTRSGAIPWETR